MKIYHAPKTRSVRPVWLCYELDLAIEVKLIEFSPQFLNSDEWKAISPTRKVPVLVDGDLTMFESGAMVEYILDRYGKGRFRPPPGTNESALYRQWCWFAEATLIRPLGVYRILKGRSGPAEDLVADAEDKLHTSMAAVESALSDDRKFLVGDGFTGADIMMGYSVALIERLMGDRYPKTKAYLGRVSSRPAYKKVLELTPNVV